jgi:peptide/nickel transport system substrate-binding protein
MIKKLLFALMTVILISSLVLAGCSQQTATTTTPATTTPAAGTPKHGGTLRIADPIGPRTSIGWIADPVGFLGGVFSNIFMDTILESDVNGIIKPGLALKYEVSDDLKTVTLTLRQGVKFHDGSDLNASVLKWNLDQLIAAKIGDYANVSSVDKVDDYTVKLNVTKYANTLLNYIASTFVVSEQAYIDHGANQDAIDWMRWNPVGTGPFKFVSYTPNVVIKGTRFDDYWQKGKPYVDNIEFYIIGDQMTRAQSLQAGEMDVIDGDLSKVEYDLQQQGYPIVKGYISTGGLVPDSKNADSPLSKLQVRQAIDCAIDRQALCDNLGYGFWAPTEQYAVPGTSTYITSIPTNNYNVTKAKQLLTDAGYPDGFKCTLYGSVAITSKDFATAVQGYLDKIGISMEVNLMDHAAYTDLSLKGWKDGFAAGAKAVDGNMNYAINLAWTQTTPYHPSMDKPDAFQALYNTAAAAKNFDPALTQKCIQYMYDNMMYIPVYCVSRGQVMQSYVKDTGFYTFHNWASWRPADVWLDK